MSETIDPSIVKLEGDLARGHFGQPVHCLVGFEIDYGLRAVDLDSHGEQEIQDAFGQSKQSLQSQRELLDVTIRRQAHDQIAGLIPRNDQQEAKRQAWLEQVPALSCEELVMFAAHQVLATPTLTEPKLEVDRAMQSTVMYSDTVEYRFGKQIYQSGYYDNVNSPEMRTNPARPSVALARQQQVIDGYRSLSRTFGVDLSFGTGHTNMSFWRPSPEGYKPLHDLETEEGLEASRRIAVGMLLAVREATPAYMSRDTPSTYDGLHKYSVGHMRTNTIRIAPDRFELRIGYGEQEKTERKVAAMIGGFIHGMETDYPIPIGRAPGFGPTELYRKERDIHILRAVEHSRIGARDQLRLDPGYANVRGEQILTALSGYNTLAGRNTGAMWQASGLVETISFENDRLRCNPDAMAQWKGTLSQEDHAALDAAGAQLEASYVDGRLATIAFTGMRHIIEAAAPDDYISPGTLPSRLERYRTSPILAPVIPAPLREQDVAERLSWQYDRT